MTSLVERQIKKAYLVAAKALVDGRVSLDQMEEAGLNVERPIFTVGQVAQVANVHPQTLRQYDRMKLLVPQRTAGGARRYSLRDVDRLAQAQHLGQVESINLAGIVRILALSEENRQLRRQVERLKRGADSIFAAATDGEVVEIRRSRRAWRKPLFKPLQITATAEAYDDDDDMGDTFDGESMGSVVEGKTVTGVVENVMRNAQANRVDIEDAGAEDIGDLDADFDGDLDGDLASDETETDGTGSGTAGSRSGVGRRRSARRR